MSRLGSEGRLTRTRRTAYEQEDGQLELLQRVQPAQSAHRPPRFGLTEHLGGNLGQPVEIELDLTALAHVRLGQAREVIRPRRRQARRGERARHQPL